MPSSSRDAHASPHTVWPVIARVMPVGADAAGASPDVAKTAATTVPAPGADQASHAVVSRTRVPSPMPRVPRDDTPSSIAPARSRMPGPASIASTSSAASMPVRRTRSSTDPEPACRTWFVASSDTTRPTSAARESGIPRWSAVVAAARRTPPTADGWSIVYQAPLSRTLRGDSGSTTPVIGTRP